MTGHMKQSLLKLKLLAAAALYRHDKREMRGAAWRNALHKALRGLSDTGIEEFYHITKA